MGPAGRARLFGRHGRALDIREGQKLLPGRRGVDFCQMNGEAETAGGSARPGTAFSQVTNTGQIMVRWRRRNNLDQVIERLTLTINETKADRSRLGYFGRAITEGSPLSTSGGSDRGTHRDNFYLGPDYRASE